MEQFIENILIGIRQWVNGKIADINTAIEGKQDVLTAGDNIEITSGGTISVTGITSATEQALEDMSFVISSNINELDGRLTAVENGKQDTLTAGDNIEITSAGTISVTGITEQDLLVETTYSELKSLRDNGELVPGQLYRITDYVTTTTQEGTRSAGHAFDIIVIALSNSELSEEAKAIAHSGDTYFANCELSVWELKYCLDNDTIRFAWADETNGKGVIYYMKDEWNNECPYDFKNIQFKRYAITNVSTTGYTQDETSALSETFLFGNNGNKCFATKDVYGNWVPANESHQSGSDSQNTSIEWEIDENTFAWYYTFNGEKKESADGEIELYDITSQKLILSPECIQWLESEGSGSDISDNCYNNSIKPRTWEYFGDDAYYKGRIVLNDIVFLNGVSYCYYNNEDEYWEYSTAYCYGNVFGVECGNNTIGNGFQNNTIGNEFYQNTIGNDVYNNTIGNNFQYNRLGEGVQYLDFTTNYGSVTLQYLYVLSGYKYNAKTSVPTGITANAVYSQTIGFNTAGSFVVKNMLD